MRRRLLNFIEQYSSRLLWLLIILYSLFFSALSIWKYNYFLYNGLDLAIINNVFYNTLHGNWFWSSIQGHTYLGDHFTPILILLLPLYYFWSSPETLLILQSVGLALTAWPIYKISQLVLKDNRLALSISLLWLINPLVHNANLFEFHFISLLPVLFLSLFYYYLKIKINPRKKLLLCFYTLMLLCLMIREDVAFIILLFLILAVLNNLKNKKILYLISYGLLITLSWVVISFFVVSHFSLSNFSPFAYYYQWLFKSDFNLFIKHLFSLTNLEMLIGFLLPFLFIPLIKPKWLLISLVPLGQIIFSAHGGGALVWKLHYGLLFMPALMITFIYSFKKINHLLAQQFKNYSLLIIILIISNFYLWADLGPLTLNLKQFASGPRSIKQLVESISPSAAVLSSYDFLPHLSSRQDIYALNYYFLGRQQFGAAEYILTDRPEYILISFQDLINFNLQFSQLDWTKKYYQQGDNRLGELLEGYGVVKVIENVVLFKKDYPSQIKLYDKSANNYVLTTGNRQVLNFNNQIKVADYNISRPKHTQLQLALNFYSLQPPNKDYQLKIELSDGQNKYQKYLPLVYGLYPTSEWKKNELIKVNYWLSSPAIFNLNKIEKIKLSLVELNGSLAIDKLGVVKLKINQEKRAGQPLILRLNGLDN